MKGVILLLCLLLSSLTFDAAGKTVSKSVYNKLSRVHELMEQQRYDQAMHHLRSIKPAKIRRYERALVLQTFGYLHAAMEDYPQAIDSLVQCLALKTLPESARKTTLYTLAQLQLAVADAKAAVHSLQAWLALEKSPPAQAHALAGRIYAQAKRYDLSIGHWRKAIGLSDGANEPWYQQFLSVLYAADDFTSASDLLERMTRLFPEQKGYWLQLSAVYRRLDDDPRALAVLELLLQRGLLNGEAELIDLVNYYRYLDMPHKAGRLLTRAMQDKRVATTAEHWKLLSDSWLQAKEMQKAVYALERAAGMARSAKWYLRLARLAMQMDHADRAIDAADAALRAEDIGQAGDALILKGIAHFNKQELPAAKGAFELALRDLSVQEKAQRWLDYLNSEMAFANQSMM